jgi:hypothetical protein
VLIYKAFTDAEILKNLSPYFHLENNRNGYNSTTNESKRERVRKRERVKVSTMFVER